MDSSLFWGHLYNRLESEVCELREKLKRLELENLSVTDQLKIANVNQKKEVETILGRVFTPGQIKKLMNPEKKRIKWSPEDISSAISFRSVTPKGYR
jgi:predicted nuclease with TOPRIM domain